MQMLARNLNSIDHSISNDELILYILTSFGSEYEAIVVNLTARNEPLNLQEVQFALQTHKMRIEQQISPLPTYLNVPPSAKQAFKKFSPNNSAQSNTSGRGSNYNTRGRGRGSSGDRGYGRGNKPIC